MKKIENIHSLKKSFSENVYDRKRITLEKTSSFSFLSVLKYNMIYMLFLSKPENMITKVQVYRKKGYILVGWLVDINWLKKAIWKLNKT